MKRYVTNLEAKHMQGITTPAAQAGCIGYLMNAKEQPGGNCSRCDKPWRDHQLGVAQVPVSRWTPHALTASAIDALAADITTWANDKGFWEVPQSIALHAASSYAAQSYIERMIKSQKLMLVVTEIVEGFEAIRKHELAQASDHIPTFTAEEEEIADTIIRLLDYAGHYQLRIGACIDNKMVFNTTREHKHGKNF